ncbi:MAG: phosphatidate cytidylyltransferase [Gemmatimonadaceae bacterium]|nr:phosphatidate cytidylyltransferase [Gemmatimonadaceae bacterium]
MSEFPKRLLVAIVLIPIVVGVIYAGGPALVTLLTVASGLAAWEFFRLAQARGARPLMGVGVVASALIPVIVHARYLGLWVPSVAMVALAVPLLLTVALFARGVAGGPMAAVGTTLVGVLYTGGMLSFAYALRYHDYVVDAKGGTMLVLLPVVVTWLNDTGAYLAGRAFGKRKLMPTVSPKKTWAGAYGAVVASVLTTWLFAAYLLPPTAQLSLRPLGIVLVGLVLSVAAQVGDLAESMFKREADVKDSSALIPGHGGVLDRVDSLLFTLPVGYVLLGAYLVYRP